MARPREQRRQGSSRQCWEVGKGPDRTGRVSRFGQGPPDSSSPVQHGGAETSEWREVTTSGDRREASQAVVEARPEERAEEDAVEDRSTRPGMSGELAVGGPGGGVTQVSLKCQQKRSSDSAKQNKQPDEQVNAVGLTELRPWDEVRELPWGWSEILEGPVGGRTQQYLENWKVITSDPEILEMVQGVRLDFMEQPPLGKPKQVEPRFSNKERDMLDVEIEELIQKRAVE